MQKDTLVCLYSAQTYGVRHHSEELLCGESVKREESITEGEDVDESDDVDVVEGDAQNGSGNVVRDMKTVLAEKDRIT